MSFTTEDEHQRQTCLTDNADNEDDTELELALSSVLVSISIFVD